MARLRTLALGLFVVGTLMGCGGPGYLRADAIDQTLRGVAKRHDTYTLNDESLSPLQRKVNLRDTELLLRLLDESSKEAE